MDYRHKIKIKILDEVNVAIIGIRPEHIDYFVNRYSKYAPNYYFQPKYKLGVWDGKITYFTKAGKTYVYLLDEIVPILRGYGYRLSLEDRREYGTDADNINENCFAHILHPETGKPFILRDYQCFGVNALIDNAGGVCIAGTGAGKTLMNAALVDAYGKKRLKTITIVPSQDLILQTKEDFILWGLDTGEFSGSVKDTKHQHIVSTWQALQNTPHVLNTFEAVVVDECHGIKGKVLTDLLNKYGKNIKYRFGLTGTLPKEETDLMAVRIAVGKVVYEMPAHKLIEQQHLADLKIDVYVLEENLKEEYKEHKEHNPLNRETYKQFKDSYYGEWTSEKRFLQSYKPRLWWIRNFIELKASQKKGNVLCLVNGIAFGKKLAKSIPGSHFVYGKDDKLVRKQIYDLFQGEDNLIVFASIQIASTGLNIPRIFNLVFIDVGKSFIRVIQSIGRGLRKAEDKTKVSVSDICSDLKYSKKHLPKRISYYKEAKYKFKKRIVKYDE